MSRSTIKEVKAVNKIKMLIFFALVTIMLMVTAVPGSAENPEEVEYIRCAVFGGTENSSVDQLNFPSDLKVLSNTSKIPHSEGGRGGNLVNINNSTYFRTVFPYGSDYLSVSYDLTKDIEKDDSTNSDNTADSDNEDIEDKNEESSVETETEGTVIDGIVVLGVYISSNSVSYGSYMDTFITFTDSEGKNYVCQASLQLDRPYIIYADIGDAENTEFDSIQLHATHDGTVTSSLVVTTSLPASTHTTDLSILEKGELLSVVSHDGLMTLNVDSFTLGTDTGDVLISVLPEENAQDSDPRTAFVTLGCAEGEGTVATVDISGSYTDSSHAVFHGSGLIPIRTVRNGNGPIELRFRSSNEEYLVIDSIRYYSTDEIPYTAGSFTTLTYSNGNLSATGKISSDIVNEYPNASIGLYTESVTTPGEQILLEKIKMTSRFSFSVSLEKYPHAHTDNTFFVGVITDDDVIVVTKSRFVSAKSVSAPVSSILGLHGANPISVFESGVPHILMDVDLSRLIASASASSTTVSRGGYIYGIDSEYLRKLDSDIIFYRSIGVSVYIRFICSGSIISTLDTSHLTYEGVSNGEFMLRADNPESLNIYPAAAAFLSQRYSNIASFVISSGVNSKDLTGIEYSRLWNSVNDVALISRLVYGASSEYIPNVTVTIPLELTGDSLYAPAETFAALFSEKLISMGDIPWCIMYTADGDSPSVLCENIRSSARLNAGSSPAFFTVMYKARNADGDSTSAYESYCNACSTSSVKLVFLSVEALRDGLSRESYSALKNYGNAKDSFIFGGSAEVFDSLTEQSITGSVSLWDFTSTYSPEGWSAGYGMSSLQSSSVFDAHHSRTLRCITDPTSPAGIFLCSLNEAINLKDAPLAEFVFDLDCVAGTQVIFIFGNDSRRAEFSLSDTAAYEKDGKLHAVCDLTEYSATAGDVGYVGVIIYSPSRVTFELSRVNVHSTSLDNTAVASILASSDEADVNTVSAEFVVVTAIVVFVILAVTVKIASVLAKQDAKNKELFKSPKKRRF